MPCVRITLILFLLVGPRPAHAAIELSLVASGVPYLVGIEHAGDASGRLFLVSQAGPILVLDGTIRATAFLDLSAIVRFDGEQGLLGLAFHPEYAANGFFYVNYVNLAGNTVVARYRVSANPDVADPASAAVVLTQSQPFTNHKGGQIRFGPDNYLYIALGDGGSGGDPQNNSQRLDTLLGKMLRIDVDAGAPYAIPPGNPFVGVAGVRPEIWSLGLRNPWRFSFDRLTGDVFIADVGQGAWEEIDFEPAGTSGRNYGWRVMEGNHCYPPGTATCAAGSFTAPVIEYGHDVGCSVTGGFRYRGTGLPAYAGTYFFGDYCSGRIWGAVLDAGSWTATQLLDTSISIATFGEDSAGNLYVGHYTQSGQLYRIVSDPTPPPRLTTSKAGNGGGLISSTPAAVHCGAICGVAAAGSTLALAVTPEPGVAFVGWSGHADCLDGTVTLTADRPCTANFTSSFTDHTLVAGVTPVRAVHVLELRARIDGQRRRFGLSGFAWTDTIAAGLTLVRAVHVVELRTALDQAYQSAGRTPPTYTDATLPAGMPIRAVHIVELRNGVLALE